MLQLNFLPPLHISEISAGFHSLHFYSGAITATTSRALGDGYAAARLATITLVVWLFYYVLLISFS